MAVNSIHDTIAGMLGSYGASNSKSEKTAAEENAEAKQTYTAASREKYPDTLHGQTRKQVDEMLDGIPYEGDKLTMQDVINYRDSMRDELETTIRTDLEKLGVDLDQDIDLAYDQSSGLVQCSSDHPDADLINRYFKANPELCEQYAGALKLSRMTGLAEQEMTPAQLQASLQQSAVSIWWEASGAAAEQSGTLMGTLSQGSGMQTYQGLNVSV